MADPARRGNSFQDEENAKAQKIKQMKQEWNNLATKDGSAKL